MEASLDEAAALPSSNEEEARVDADPSAHPQLDDVGGRLAVPQARLSASSVPCAFCGAWCQDHGRRSPVRRRGTAGHQRRAPRLPRASRAPPPLD